MSRKSNYKKEDICQKQRKDMTKQSKVQECSWRWQEMYLMKHSSRLDSWLTDSCDRREKRRCKKRKNKKSDKKSDVDAEIDEENSGRQGMDWVHDWIVVNKQLNCCLFLPSLSVCLSLLSFLFEMNVRNKHALFKKLLHPKKDVMYVFWVERRLKRDKRQRKNKLTYIYSQEQIHPICHPVDTFVSRIQTSFYVQVYTCTWLQIRLWIDLQSTLLRLVLQVWNSQSL